MGKYRLMVQKLLTRLQQGPQHTPQQHPQCKMLIQTQKVNRLICADIVKGT